MKKYTRLEKRTRKVPHTRGGVQRMVDEEYEVEVFVPPRDWDRDVQIVVGVATGVMGVVTLVWSTASIGSLLSRRVDPDFVAYLAATPFDIGWMVCAGREWLNRHNPREAELPRRAGHVALVAAMAAVFADGWLADSWISGLVGAVISLITKGLWMLAMRQATRRLNPLTQQWLDQADDEAAAKLAELHRTRQLQAAQYRCAVEAAALAIQPTPFAIPVASNPVSAGAADPGMPPPAEDAPQKSPVNAAKTKPEQLKLPQEDVVLRIAPPGQSVRDTTKTAVASGIRSKEAVQTYVRSVHGDDVNPETVDRYRRAFIKKAG
ncbi:protein transporter Sec31 [Streptomyces triculaminicus]|uniref:protein transporter Sec31 n=1 Tax=Streptomyces triculaminicus TaxID=2816232 RepID=UPI0037908C1C